MPGIHKGSPGPWRYVAGRVRGQPRRHPQDRTLGLDTAQVVDTLAHVSCVRSVEQQDADGRTMAAGLDFLEALTGHDSPDLWRIQWLNDLLNLVGTEHGPDLLAEALAEDPDSINEMLSELRKLVRQARAAIAKAQGETP